MQNYNQGHHHHQSNKGFYNPFEQAVHRGIMPQGYTGYNSFITRDVEPQPQQSKTQIILPGIRKNKIQASTDGNTKKRWFKGKYSLNAPIPIKYNTVDYFMLVENVRINNENALRGLKRGKAKDILNQVLDSLEFLSYVHK